MNALGCLVALPLCCWALALRLREPRPLVAA
jgi:hypothetical protein